MKIFNKYIILFTFFVAFLFFIVWSLLQTERFAYFVSSHITKQVSRKFNLDFKFQKIEIKLFPPATVFYQTKISGKNKEINLEASSLGIYYGILDIFSNKVTIENILLNDGKVNFPISKFLDSKSEPLSLEKWVEFINEKKFLLEKNNLINLKMIQLVDVDIIDKDLIASIKRSWIRKKKKGILFKGTLENINPKIIPIKGIPVIDELNLDLEQSKEGLNITNLNAKSGLDSVALFGNFSSIRKTINFRGVVNYLGNPFKYYNLMGKKAKLLKSLDGYTDIKLNFKGPIRSPNIRGRIKGKKIKSIYFLADEIDFKFMLKNKILSITGMEVLESKGALSIKGPKKVFDFNKNRFLTDEVIVHLKSLGTNSALYYLDFLNPMKGRLSGDVNIKYSNDTLAFECQNEIVIDDFRLVFPKTKTKTLGISNIRLRKCDFELRKNYNFFLNVDLTFPKSRIKATGVIGKDGFNIKTVDSTLGLKQFGKISGVELLGNGPVDLWIRGKEEVILDFKAKFADFSILDFHLGDAVSKFKYNISKFKLEIDSFESVLGATKIVGNGELKFGKNSSIDLKIETPVANLKDSRKIYQRLVKDKIPSFEDIKIGYRTKYHVTGDFGLNDLIINGSFFSDNIDVIKEGFDELKFNFELHKSKINISRFFLKKNTGLLSGKGLFDLTNEYFEYEGSFGNFKLEDIKLYELLNFGLTGVFEGEFGGDGRGDRFNSKTHVRLVKSKVENLDLGDSKLIIFNNSEDWFLSGDLFGGIVDGKTYLNFNPNDQDKLSSINIKANADDLRVLTGVISSHNIKNPQISGFAQGELNSSFSIFHPEKLNLDITVKKFQFKNGNSLLQLNPDNNKIIIDKGKIKLWNIVLDGPNENFSSFGEGNILSNFNIQNVISLNADKIQILSPGIKKADGKIEGKATLFGNIKKFSPSLSLIGEDVKLSLSFVPGPFEEINFKLLANENEVILQELKAKYGSGEINGDGLMLYAIPFPNVDFNFKLSNTKFPLFKKSHLVISGLGHLSGKKMPYTISADLALLHGEINDTFNEILKSKNDDGEYNRFLPQDFKSQRVRLFNLDINADIVNPIVLKNNISFLNFDGNLNIFGNYMNPLVKGNLKFIPEISKFVFKGNEFLLSEGQINFLESTTKIEPELNFIGNAQVSDYDIRVKVAGKTENLGITLNSDPSLSQEDILSLLTIGITSDKSRKLQDSDRQSITSIGIGSLLIDQFQLNEGITSSLGLRLSVAPEFSEDGEEDPLAGRTGGVSGGSSSRLKSTTRIKIKKKLTKKIDISVSSTVGGTMEQKQEMNVDLNLSKNVSVEGVYEVKSSTDSESSETPNSVGADLKFQWSFK